MSSCDRPQFCLRVPRTRPTGSILFDFSDLGNVNGIKQILQQRLGSPFDVDRNGVSALMYAVTHFRLDACELLLKVGADSYQEDFFNRNAFDIAWTMILRSVGAAGEREGLSTLVPSHDYLDKQNFTLLHKTVLGLNKLDLATLLASLSIPTINEGDLDGSTAAWWAAIRGDHYSLSLLIKHGADINRANNQAKRSLDAAIASKCDICVNFLIDSDHDVKYKDHRGWTPLHHCSWHGTGTNIMQRLIDKGANADACDEEGISAMHYTAWKNIMKGLRLLISHGADMNKLDICGDSPLHSAILSNSYQTLEVLLQHNADYSLRNKTGETLLHHAAQHGDIQCLAILRSFDLSRIDVEDRVTGISSSQTFKGLVGLTALQIAERRKDITREWLETFRKLLYEVEFPESRVSVDQTVEMEEEEFEDAVESQQD